jgi:hypothetical protein
MPPPEATPQSRPSPLVGLLRLIGAVAVLIIAAIAALVVLDILPQDVLATFAMKVVIVAGIAAATIGVLTVLLPPRN